MGIITNTCVRTVNSQETQEPGRSLYLHAAFRPPRVGCPGSTFRLRVVLRQPRARCPSCRVSPTSCGMSRKPVFTRAVVRPPRAGYGAAQSGRASCPGRFVRPVPVFHPLCAGFSRLIRSVRCFYPAQSGRTPRKRRFVRPVPSHGADEPRIPRTEPSKTSYASDEAAGPPHASDEAAGPRTQRTKSRRGNWLGSFVPSAYNLVREITAMKEGLAWQTTRRRSCVWGACAGGWRPRIWMRSWCGTRRTSRGPRHSRACSTKSRRMCC